MKSANFFKTVSLLLVIVISSTVYVFAEDLDSTNYKIVGAKTASGGGLGDSTNYSVISSLGKVSADPRNYSTNYRLYQDPSAAFLAAQPSIQCFETTTDGSTACTSGPQELLDGGMVAICGTGGCYDKARFEISHTPYLYNPSLDNLVGYWPLDEASGTGAYIKDRSGVENHGTPTGTTFVDGISKGARDFAGDGSGDVINAGTSTTLEPTTEMTISAWIYARAAPITQGRTVVSKWKYVSASEQYGWELGASWTSPYLRFTVCANTNSKSISDYNFFANHLNEWIHISATYKGSEYIRLYENGQLFGENTTSIPASIIYNPNNPFTIGKRNSSNLSYWDGYIDEVMVFNKALSSTQIESLFLKENNAQNPSDTLYSVQISTDNFVNDIQYIDGSTFRPESYANHNINDYRTEAVWEAETFNIQGLSANTQYYIRLTALHGDFTESDYSTIANATTSAGSISFDIDIAISGGTDTESAPPYSVAFSSGTALIAGAATTTATGLVWLDIDSSSSGGVSVIVSGKYGGLYSATTTQTISSDTEDLDATGAEGFGLQNYYIDYDNTSPFYGDLTATTDYSGSINNVGTVSTTANKIYSGDGPIKSGRTGAYLKARAGTGIIPASDYSEEIYFILVPLY